MSDEITRQLEGNEINRIYDGTQNEMREQRRAQEGRTGYEAKLTHAVQDRREAVEREELGLPSVVASESQAVAYLGISHRELDVIRKNPHFGHLFRKVEPGGSPTLYSKALIMSKFKILSTLGKIAPKSIERNGAPSYNTSTTNEAGDIRQEMIDLLVEHNRFQRRWDANLKKIRERNNK